MVLRCFSTTVAFINCHLTANKGKTGKSEKQFGKNCQYSIVTKQLGKMLGRRAMQRTGSLGSPSSPATQRNNHFELESLFHHVVWVGDMNYKLDKGINPGDAIDMIRRGQIAELHARFDTLTRELQAPDEERSCYYNYREPNKVFSQLESSADVGVFFPTYKKKPHRPKPDFSNPSW